MKQHKNTHREGKSSTSKGNWSINTCCLGDLAVEGQNRRPEARLYQSCRIPAVLHRHGSGHDLYRGLARAGLGARGQSLDHARSSYLVRHAGSRRLCHGRETRGRRGPGSRDPGGDLARGGSGSGTPAEQARSRIPRGAGGRSPCDIWTGVR